MRVSVCLATKYLTVSRFYRRLQIENSCQQPRLENFVFATIAANICSYEGVSRRALLVSVLISRAYGVVWALVTILVSYW